MKKDKKALQLIVVVLTSLTGIIFGVISVFWRLDNYISPYPLIVAGIYYCIVFYYGFRGYKTPHGNLVRYLMLILSIYIIAAIAVSIYRWYKLPWVVLLAGNLGAMSIAYMAGRLNKFKKNIIVSVIVSVLLVTECFWQFKIPGVKVDALFYIDRSLPIFMWLTIMSIYFFRYHEHKKAGLEDGDYRITHQSAV